MHFNFFIRRGMNTCKARQSGKSSHQKPENELHSSLVSKKLLPFILSGLWSLLFNLCCQSSHRPGQHDAEAGGLPCMSTRSAHPLLPQQPHVPRHTLQTSVLSCSPPLVAASLSVNMFHSRGTHSSVTSLEIPVTAPVLEPVASLIMF